MSTSNDPYPLNLLSDRAKDLIKKIINENKFKELINNPRGIVDNVNNMSEDDVVKLLRLLLLLKVGSIIRELVQQGAVQHDCTGICEGILNRIREKVVNMDLPLKGFLIPRDIARGTSRLSLQLGGNKDLKGYALLLTPGEEAGTNYALNVEVSQASINLILEPAVRGESTLELGAYLFIKYPQEHGQKECSCSRVYVYVIAEEVYYSRI